MRSVSPSSAGRRRKDAEWKAQVLTLAGLHCERCPQDARSLPLDPHHVWGKLAHPALRHVVENGACLCRLCHGWIHDNPIEGRKWFAEHRTEDWLVVEKLRMEAQ